ncbi:leucyl/phenylalanyl-tRNA--protein transferase [Iodidimonas gelatinilytica]|uniref:Leucyl/phenylalanyl-tRNA--protein transferase n=1 Tax=Iodidimonas gelatinilytica TaxID=1236966 RepID=A0A5A7N102_9PROT|nr:leucyl/phenylalanyl-tRNA--protein transferase [Iodidimonas gelatinilytica]GER01385.1 leucyl/phenylalanyl-tRNA--protein transferase [Iodidimonas gelatinilytica]
MSRLTPDILLRAYACGLFPMADHSSSPDVFWIDPEQRGILPLDGFHIPKRLRKTIRQDRFQIRINTAFRQVMEACAQPAPGRENTWINEEILSTYSQLHDLGAAHSVECWRDGVLVGGLYGVDLAGAFFGESMFHFETDASKIATVHLVARLKWGGYRLLDTQFVTEHLEQFGAQEIPRETYQQMLKKALCVKGDFYSMPEGLIGSDVLQAITQTS